MEGEIILSDDRKHVHAFGVGRPQHLNDFTFGVRVARSPFGQFDDYFVALDGSPADISRRRNINVMADAGIVGDDIKEFTAPAQGAN